MLDNRESPIENHQAMQITIRTSPSNANHHSHITKQSQITNQKSKMILCAIDDLIFSIKISTAARHLGAELFF